MQGPKLETVFQLKPNQSLVKWNFHCPILVRNTSSNATHNCICFSSGSITLLTHFFTLIHHSYRSFTEMLLPKELSSMRYLCTWFSSLGEAPKNVSVAFHCYLLLSSLWSSLIFVSSKGVPLPVCKFDYCIRVSLYPRRFLVLNSTGSKANGILLEASCQSDISQYVASLSLWLFNQLCIHLMVGQPSFHFCSLLMRMLYQKRY